jgi:glycosyltransferase involved in cell wall biosynthesis
MVGGLRVCVVMPGYNAAKTIERTVAEIPRYVVDDVILLDDGSQDETAALALGQEVICHDRNRGHCGNRKTCYAAALRRRADIAVMVHPDYHDTPKLILALVHCLASGLYDIALCNRSS